MIRWIIYRLETHWLARTPMESPTREAVSTLIGYVLFMIAAMVVVNYAGLDLMSSLSVESKGQALIRRR